MLTKSEKNVMRYNPASRGQACESAVEKGDGDLYEGYRGPEEDSGY